MAYKHVLLVFDKPITGIFDADVVDIDIIINDKFIPTIQPEITYTTIKNISRPSESMYEGYDVNNQVLIELDEPLNNCVGDITVSYKAGFLGSYGEPVLPFENIFTPSEMQPVYLLRDYSRLGYSNTPSTKLNYINKSSVSSDDKNTAALQTVTYGAITVSLNYVGQIKP